MSDTPPLRGLEPWEQASQAPPPPAPLPPWEQAAAPPPPDRSHDPAVAKMVESSPGIREANGPLESLQAAWQQSDIGLALRGKMPDLAIPKNKTFVEAVAAAVGGEAGDLPAQIVGGAAGLAAGTAAGAAVTAETGPGAAGGAAIGGVIGTGAGAFALPQAIREGLMDYYQRDNLRTSGDFLRMVSKSAWNIGKSAAAGAVAGPIGAVGGKAAVAIGAPAAARGLGEAAGFAIGATGAQAALDRKMPDPQDAAVAAVTVLGMHAAGVTLSGAFEPSPAAKAVIENGNEIFRQTGIPHWDQAKLARNDPKLRDELMAQDINGGPIAPKFNAMRPDDAPPFKTNAMSIRDEHDKEVQHLTGQAFTDAHVAQLLPMVRALEGSGDDAVSPAGAVGRHQIMPQTAAQYGLDPARLFEPAYNEFAAKTILSDLVRRFNGDRDAILVAYNAGPGRAFKYLNSGRDPSVLPRETQQYLAHAGNLFGTGGKPLEQLPPKPAAETGIDYAGLSTADRVARVQALTGEPQPKARRPTTFGFEMELDAARRIDNRMQMASLIDPKKEMTLEDAARQTLGSSSRLTHFLWKGPVKYEPGPGGGAYLPGEGPSFRDVIEEIAKDGGTEDAFDTYRISQRTVQKAVPTKQNPKGINLGVLRGGVEEANANIADPNLARYAKADMLMQDWKRGGLQYAKDGGLLNDKRMQAMIAANTSHVSINRLAGDTAVFQGRNKGFFRAKNPFHLMEGGEKGKIVRPLLADVLNQAQIVKQTDRNIASRFVLDTPLYRNVLVEKVVKSTGEELKTDLPLNDEEKEAYRSFLERAGEKKLHPTQSFVWLGGERHTITWKDEDIARMMRGAETPGEATWLLRVASFPAKMMRAGIVTDPSFAVSVVMKHMLTASVFSPHHPAPFYTSLRGLGEVIDKGDAFWDFARNGGLDSTLPDIDRSLNDNIAGVFETTGVNKRLWNTAANPVELAHFVTRAAQSLTSGGSNAGRIGEFKTLTEKGLPASKAAMAGRKDFLDFGEGFVSAHTQNLARMIPFFKPSVLGLKQGGHGVRFDTAKVMTGIGALVLFQTAMYVASRKQDEQLDPRDQSINLPPYSRDMYFTTPSVGGMRFHLPMPFNYGPLVGIPFNRFLDFMYDKDPHAFDGALEEFAHTDIQPFSIPPAFKPELEQATGFNFSTGRPLLPDRLRHVAPDLQFSDYTSPAAKDLAHVLGPHGGLGVANLSPIVMDQYVRDWGGTLGEAAEKALALPLGEPDRTFDVHDLPFVKSFLVRQPGMNAREIGTFYDEAGRFEQAHAGMLLLRARGEMTQAQSELPQAIKYGIAVSVKKALSIQRNLVKEIDATDKMDTDEKRQLTDRIVNDAILSARYGTLMLRGKNPEDVEIRRFFEQMNRDVSQGEREVRGRK